MAYVIENGEVVEVTTRMRKVSFTEHWVTAVDGSFQTTKLPEDIYETEEEAINANCNRRRV